VEWVGIEPAGIGGISEIVDAIEEISGLSRDQHNRPL
jgi:hypothetical protein